MALKFNGGSLVSRPKEDTIPQNVESKHAVSVQNEPEMVSSLASLANEPAQKLAQPAFREAGRKKEAVNHPAHYGGKDNPYEVIKVIRAWELNFTLGNVIKYIARAGRKDPSKKLEDLHKAMWYLQEEIANEYERSIK